MPSTNPSFRSEVVDSNAWAALRPAHQLYLQLVLASNYNPHRSTLAAHDTVGEAYVLDVASTSPGVIASDIKSRNIARFAESAIPSAQATTDSSGVRAARKASRRAG